MKKTIISRSVFDCRCHQVQRLRTKSIRYPPGRQHDATKGSLPKPPDPLQMKSDWTNDFGLIGQMIWTNDFGLIGQLI